MRAKGRSPTSAIAPPASIENHASDQSPSRISTKLLGCQQSQMASSRSNRIGIDPEWPLGEQRVLNQPTIPHSSLEIRSREGRITRTRFLPGRDVPDKRALRDWSDDH